MALTRDRSHQRSSLAALAIRVVWVFATPDYGWCTTRSTTTGTRSRSLAVDGFARSYGRETAFRPPAYPLFLAGVYWIVGPRWLEWARLATRWSGPGSWR